MGSIKKLDRKTVHTYLFLCGYMQFWSLISCFMHTWKLHQYNFLQNNIVQTAFLSSSEDVSPWDTLFPNSFSLKEIHHLAENTLTLNQFQTLLQSNGIGRSWPDQDPASDFSFFGLQLSVKSIIPPETLNLNRSQTLRNWVSGFLQRRKQVVREAQKHLVIEHTSSSRLLPSLSAVLSAHNCVNVV